MPTLSQTIQDRLNSCALIIRKYNLGDKVYFFDIFSEVNNAFLLIAWEFGQKKIQNKEIIKDAHNIPTIDLEIIIQKVKSINPEPKYIYEYLNRKFELKPLKLVDENIERRVRKLLAIKYLEIVSEEITLLQKKHSKSFRYKANKFIKKFQYGLIAISIISVFATPRIIRGLTSVDKLTERFHESSKYKYRIGAICNDGWKSSATGGGACSHHKGVREWVYRTDYRKTWEECRKKAKRISWLD